MQEWQKEMANAVGDDLLRDIVKDNRSAPPPKRPAAAVQVGTKGWINPRPLVRPQGDYWLTAEKIRERELQRLSEKIRQLGEASIAEQNEDDPPPAA